MIKNERQYRVTKTWADRFASDVRELVQRSGPTLDVDPVLAKAQLDAATSQLEELRCQLDEYDALRSGQQSSWSVTSLDDLPTALIRARIANGLSQKELADRLGLKEQQIQRYEATDYESASLARIMDIADALGLHLGGTASVIGSATVAPRA